MRSDARNTGDRAPFQASQGGTDPRPDEARAGRPPREGIDGMGGMKKQKLRLVEEFLWPDNYKEFKEHLIM